MSNEKTIVQLKREYYKAKRVKLIEHQANLQAEGKEIDSLAMGFVIDQVQETIGDLKDIMNEIENYQKHNEMCLNLITNKLKSNGKN